MEVSVVIPLFNMAGCVAHTLQSVLAQTFEDFEVIVVDDGSTDGGDRVVEEIGDPRIRLIRKKNAGVGAARNTGVKAANAEWIAFLDADDQWLPDKLSLQWQAIADHPKAVWAACGFMRVDGDKVIVNAEEFKKHWFEANNLLRDVLVPLAHGCHIWTGTVMAKRDVLLDTGGFDEGMLTGQDKDMWFRLAARHPKLVYLSNCLAKYNIDTERSLTKSGLAYKDMEVIFKLAHHLSLLSLQISPRRAKLLKKFVKRDLLDRAGWFLYTGRRDLAIKILEEKVWLDLGFSGALLRIKASIPSWAKSLFR